MIAGRPEWSLVGVVRLADERKVRTPQGSMPRASVGGSGATQGNGKCHRKQTAFWSFGPEG
ncbi:hypothetical protein GCM10023213_37030 [Prosthecobacter algae]|uniref:Uncharacterized protein n=1 Tax=Prosthecobacter algae TaxID=1144682 RepID=A0ABP9PEU7_9BACT